MNPAAPQLRQDDTTGLQPMAPSAAVGVALGPNGSVLTAQALLAGRPWVGIEHNGQHYRLQTTRSGKLILTK